MNTHDDFEEKPLRERRDESYKKLNYAARSRPITSLKAKTGVGSGTICSAAFALLHEQSNAAHSLSLL